MQSDDKEAQGQNILDAAKQDERFLVRQQGISLRDMTEIANKVALQIPRLIVCLVALCVIGNGVGFGLLWDWNAGGIGDANGTRDTSNSNAEQAVLYTAVVEHLRYYTVATLLAIAVVISSCVIGIRGIFAILLKRAQSQEE